MDIRVRHLARRADVSHPAFLGPVIAAVSPNTSQSPWCMPSILLSTSPPVEDATKCPASHHWLLRGGFHQTCISHTCQTCLGPRHLTILFSASRAAQRAFRPAARPRSRAAVITQGRARPRIANAFASSAPLCMCLSRWRSTWNEAHSRVVYTMGTLTAGLALRNTQTGSYGKPRREKRDVA